MAGAKCGAPACLLERCVFRAGQVAACGGGGHKSVSLLWPGGLHSSRVWRCAEFQVVRSQVLPPGFPAPRDRPECQRFHAWDMQPHRQIELWSLLAALPDTSWDFDGLPESAQLDLFVDGSCIFP